MILKFKPCGMCKKVNNCAKLIELQKVYIERLKKMEELEKEGDFVTLQIEKECDDFEKKITTVTIRLLTCQSCAVLDMRTCPKCAIRTQEKFCGKCGNPTDESCQDFKKLNEFLEEHSDIFEELKSGDAQVKKADLNLACPHYIKNTPGSDRPE